MKTLTKRRRNIVDLKKRARRVLKASINLVQQRWGKLDRRKHSTTSIHIYELRPRADKHGFDLSSDALRYSPLWYRGSNAIVDAVGYAKSYSQRYPVVIRVYDASGQRDRDARIQGRFQRGAARNRRFEFSEQRRFFILTHNKTLSVAVSINNPR